VRPARARPFEDVRAEIEAALKKQRMGRRFAESAEAFSNLVYEQADSLQPAADKFKLKVQDGGWISRPQAKVPELNHPRVLAALFSDDVIKNRRNTEAIEVASGTVVAARVAEHRPVTQRPLDEVRGEVVKLMVQKEAAELAAKEGAKKLEQLRKGEAAGVNFGPARTITRQGVKEVPEQVAAAAFKAPRASLPAYAGVQGQDGYHIVRVTRIVPPKLDEETEKRTQAELGQDAGERHLEAYLSALRASTKVEVNKQLLEKKAE
jgi:peptidyl-prolyl cis-trans isomerase D